MRGTVVAAVAAGLLVTGSEAIQLVKRDIPSVVAIGIQRKSIDNPVDRDRIRRRAGKTVSQTLDNYQVRWCLIHAGVMSKLTGLRVEVYTLPM